MKNQLAVQHAVMCLQELDQHSSEFLSAQDISRTQGIPLAACEAVLERLARAGIIESSDDRLYALCVPVEDVKALDILQALAMPVPVHPAFKVLFAARKSALRKTLKTVQWAQALLSFPSDGGAASA